MHPCVCTSKHTHTSTMSKSHTFSHNVGIFLTIICVSYTVGKSPVVKRMFWYNHHYFFPASLVCIKVSLQAFTLPSSGLFVAVTKVIDHRLPYPQVFTEGFPVSNLCNCLFKFFLVWDTGAVHCATSSKLQPDDAKKPCNYNYWQMQQYIICHNNNIWVLTDKMHTQNTHTNSIF